MEKMYVALKCFNYNRIELIGYATLDDYANDVNVIYNAKKKLPKFKTLERARQVAFDTMSDMVVNLNYDYVITSCKFINEEDMTNELSNSICEYYCEDDVEYLKMRYPQISHIDFDVDEDCGKSLSICWMKFPYINEASDGGLFHFTTKKDFDKWINLSHIATIEDMGKRGIESCQYEEYNGECIPLEDLWEDIRKWKKENGVA